MKATWTKWLGFGLFMLVASSFCVVAQPAESKDNDNGPPPKMGPLRDVAISADGKLAMAGDSERNIWV